MENEKKSAIIVGLKTALFLSLAYAFIVLVIAMSTNTIVFYALFGLPLVFVLSCFLGLTMKLGMLKFINPDSVYNALNNPVDNYFSSKFDKSVGSIILTVLCFLPTLIFYFFFSWIFYIVKRKSAD
ncbi:MAG: hypothetical protein K2K80_04205 [Clostridia bacterium]|nr:hypothetical protein [Clostridia bacterium]